MFESIRIESIRFEGCNYCFLYNSPVDYETTHKCKRAMEKGCAGCAYYGYVRSVYVLRDGKKYLIKRTIIRR